MIQKEDIKRIKRQFSPYFYTLILLLCIVGFVAAQIFYSGNNSISLKVEEEFISNFIESNELSLIDIESSYIQSEYKLELSNIDKNKNSFYSNPLNKEYIIKPSSDNYNFRTTTSTFSTGSEVCENFFSPPAELVIKDSYYFTDNQAVYINTQESDSFSKLFIGDYTDEISEYTYFEGGDFALEKTDDPIKTLTNPKGTSIFNDFKIVNSYSQNNIGYYTVEKSIDFKCNGDSNPERITIQFDVQVNRFTISQIRVYKGYPKDSNILYTQNVNVAQEYISSSDDVFSIVDLSNIETREISKLDNQSLIEFITTSDFVGFETYSDYSSSEFFTQRSFYPDNEYGNSYYGSILEAYNSFPNESYIFTNSDNEEIQIALFSSSQIEQIQNTILASNGDIKESDGGIYIDENYINAYVYSINETEIPTSYPSSYPISNLEEPNIKALLFEYQDSVYLVTARDLVQDFTVKSL